ncbi:MAG: hypothetical protein R3B47_13580 [Bacteroidia bacterium]
MLPSCARRRMRALAGWCAGCGWEWESLFWQELVLYASLAVMYDDGAYLGEMMIFFLVVLFFGFLLGSAFTLVISVIPWKWIGFKKRLDFWLPLSLLIVIGALITFYLIIFLSQGSWIKFFK